MSPKSRKKHKTQSRKPVSSYVHITKTYFDDFTRTARKFMLLIGLEPADFDALSKRTKQHLMIVKHTPWRIYASKESRVPRSYIQFFNKVMTHHEKTSFYGDPAFNISYLEYLTYGLTLIFSIRNYDTREIFWTQDQIELLERIKTPLIEYTTTNEADHFAIRTNDILKKLFLYVSQPNYRYYTGKEHPRKDFEKGRIENQIIISSIEPERKKFLVDGKTHSSYRLGYYDIFPGAKNLIPVMAEIPMNLLDIKNSKTLNQLMNQIKTDIKLPVYIQNHALHRAAERMDCKNNMYLNCIFSISFLFPDVITATNGQRLIKARDEKGNTVGYFPFIKQDGAILLLSFLPLSSPITPEGSILHKELGIQLEDSLYIGLDKFSFYTQTEFETIPKLKQALKKAAMWHLTEIQPDIETERKENHILQNFFVETAEAYGYTDMMDSAG